MPNTSADSFWKANIRLVLSLLSIWFFISFVCGILLVDFLDNFRFGCFKLGFWIAQQGSILTFIALILIYIHSMDKLDSQYKHATSNDGQDSKEAPR